MQHKGEIVEKAVRESGHSSARKTLISKSVLKCAQKLLKCVERTQNKIKCLKLQKQNSKVSWLKQNFKGKKLFDQVVHVLVHFAKQPFTRVYAINKVFTFLAQNSSI